MTNHQTTPTPCFDAPAWLNQARSLIGTSYVLTEDLDAYTRDWRGKFTGKALAVLRPANTAQVKSIVRLCAQNGVSIVPQGGNTGICGASVPDSSGEQVVLSLSRLNKVRELDAANSTITAEAGCVLQTLQDLATQAGRLFPLSLGSEGSCQIGGNVATNAGGIHVLRYGNTRDLILGLEVILPNGDCLDLLRGLRKDNTGYDLKQLFIGSEGTLGLITAVTVKLFPLPTAYVVGYAGLDDLEQAVSLLQTMRSQLGDRFTAFEVVSGPAFDLVRQYFPETPQPLASSYPWYVLMEAADNTGHDALSGAMQRALENAMEAGHLADVAVAVNDKQAAALWTMRENVAHAQQMDGANIKHDIALAISQIPGFVKNSLGRLEDLYPNIRPIVFGHLGDGNLHFNLSAPPGVPITDWQLETAAINTLVHDMVVERRGSISAEHGIGQLKRDDMAHYKTQTELAVMRAIKKSLDPKNLMNPGKVLA
jgi:FAD/FMN-containing dehydrogenase